MINYLLSIEDIRKIIGIPENRKAYVTKYVQSSNLEAVYYDPRSSVKRGRRPFLYCVSYDNLNTLHNLYNSGKSQLQFIKGMPMPQHRLLMAYPLLGIERHWLFDRESKQVYEYDVDEKSSTVVDLHGNILDIESIDKDPSNPYVHVVLSEQEFQTINGLKFVKARHDKQTRTESIVESVLEEKKEEVTSLDDQLLNSISVIKNGINEGNLAMLVLKPFYVNGKSVTISVKID